MSNPRASPFTSCVLPAPRSPDKPMTSPLCATRPQASPSASVSAGLCEMYVAIGGQQSHPILVPNRDPLARRDFTDATQRHFGKLLPPGVEQRDRLAAGHREEQLKILPLGQRCQQRRFGG